MSLAVLQIVAGLDPASGGPPASAVATALGLRQQGVVNSLAYPVERGREDASAELVAVLHRAGIGVYGFPEPAVFGSFGRRWGISPRLALWLLRNGSRFDIIHTHSGWAFTTVMGLVSAKLYRRVAILSPHESLTDYDREKSGPFRSMIKQVGRWAYLRSFDSVVVASALEQDDMGDRAGIRSVVVAHGVRGISVARNPSSREGLRVGFLGRLHPKKNMNLLIDALASLPGDVSLHVAGDGPQEYRESLVARARSRGVDERILWLGFVEGVAKREFLASIDVLAMPSAFECFGVAAAEALSAGVPVVVSPHVGIADVVARYRCGQVVTADSRELTRAIRELMKDAGVRDELSRNARLAASREFSIEAHGERIRTEYERALSRRPRRDRSKACGSIRGDAGST